MDFSLSERTKEMRDLALDFCVRELVPLEQTLASRGWTGLDETMEPVRERARRTGLFAPHMPSELGGGGLTLIEQAQLSEILGMYPLGHYAFNFAAPDVGNMELLLEYGTERQKEQWLAPLIGGDIRSTFLMTEPEHAGSNPVWMSTGSPTAAELAYIPPELSFNKAGKIIQTGLDLCDLCRAGTFLRCEYACCTLFTQQRVIDIADHIDARLYQPRIQLFEVDVSDTAKGSRIARQFIAMRIQKTCTECPGQPGATLAGGTATDAEDDVLSTVVQCHSQQFANAECGCLHGIQP
ncbi:MAG: acyl-CoA dehydrogenase family protein, partial [Acidobacteriota bacterium]